MEPASNPTGGAAIGQTVNGDGGANQDSSTIPNPKLGMAPLSSERAVVAAPNSGSAETQQPQNAPPRAPLQPADLQTTQTPVSQTIDLPPPEPPAAATQVPTSLLHSEREEVARVNDAPPPLLDSTIPPPNPIPTVDGAEQPHHPPNPNPTPPDPSPAVPPTDVGSLPHTTDNAPEKVG